MEPSSSEYCIFLKRVMGDAYHDKKKPDSHSNWSLKVKKFLDNYVKDASAREKYSKLNDWLGPFYRRHKIILIAAGFISIYDGVNRQIGWEMSKPFSFPVFSEEALDFWPIKNKLSSIHSESPTVIVPVSPLPITTRLPLLSPIQVRSSSPIFFDSPVLTSNSSICEHHVRNLSFSSSVTTPSQQIHTSSTNSSSSSSSSSSSGFYVAECLGISSNVSICVIINYSVSFNKNILSFL